MRCVVQRVTEAAVRIDGELVGQAGKGFLLLIGVEVGDTAEDMDYIARKVPNLRIFEDENGKMNLSVKDEGGEILLISQFTLYGDCTHGNRPSFIAAARPETAQPLYEIVKEELIGYGIPVCTGVFGADMKIEQYNDGPVSILIESEA